MERFFSHENIESTDEPQRRLIFKLLAVQAHTMQTGANSELRVRVERRGDKYTWELRRDGHFQPVKFSAPVYLSEKAARASGNEVRTRYLERLAARRSKVKHLDIQAAPPPRLNQATARNHTTQNP
jgi:hypothetical protein